ncbi:hypothetical protein R9C00_23805 [Flammeovirgaceae bacterium SG7u.111]|nr:hypothetical protein [Flammeovirgaceae bacterium SG7u.132]WPO34727.1 hypothetical protein R9C00_23805 [Flammeovirgaceae bacterium SG7u.111]
MTSKLKILIGINIALAIGVVLSFQTSESSSTLDMNTRVFSLNDTTLTITKIQLGEDILETKGPEQWMLNSTYPVNAQRIESLVQLFQKIEVKRPVGDSFKAEVEKELARNPIDIHVFSGPTEALNYKIAKQGNETYASLPDGQLFSIYVPGTYLDLYTILDIDEQDWRDKRVLLTSWRTLKRMEVKYPGDTENSFTVEFDSVFYKVPGIQQLDSAKLYAYIQQFQTFRVEEFVQRSSLRDSLRRQQAMCIITLNDLYREQDNELLLYPGKDVFYGISQKTNEAVTLNRNMLRNFLVSRKEFIKQ